MSIELNIILQLVKSSLTPDLHVGIGMVVTAQWEILIGNSYAYIVLSAFGLFYAGFGAIITPAFGVKASYGEDIVGYNNALGFWVLSRFENPKFVSSLDPGTQATSRDDEANSVCYVLVWAVWNVFFLIGSLPL